MFHCAGRDPEDLTLLLQSLADRGKNDHLPTVFDGKRYGNFNCAGGFIGGQIGWRR
jgi:hypothetical protein